MAKFAKENIQTILNEWGLSSREKEVVEVMTKGITTQKLITEHLSISPLTVRNHLENIYRKSGCTNKSDLLVILFNQLLNHFEKLKPLMQETNFLVVDDDTQICELLETELKDKGFSVQAIHTTDKVEEILESKFYEFVLLDIHMPNSAKDGIQVVRELISNHDRTKFIIMSGEYDSVSEQALDAGAVSFLQKPIKMDELIEIVNAHQVDNLQKRYDLYFTGQDITNKLEKEFYLDLPELGTGGLFLPIEASEIDHHNLEVNQIISFTFKFNNHHEKMQAIGKVRWVRHHQLGKRDGIGVELLFVPDDFDYRLKRLANSNQIFSYIPSPD